MMQVVTKFGSVKIDDAGDTGMSFAAIYCHTTYKKLIRLLSLRLVMRTHRCISTVINLETTKFCQNLPHHLMLPNINLSYISYLI